MVEPMANYVRNKPMAEKTATEGEENKLQIKRREYNARGRESGLSFFDLEQAIQIDWLSDHSKLNTTDASR